MAISFAIGMSSVMTWDECNYYIVFYTHQHSFMVIIMAYVGILDTIGRPPGFTQGRKWVPVSRLGANWRDRECLVRIAGGSKLVPCPSHRRRPDRAA